VGPRAVVNILDMRKSPTPARNRITDLLAYSPVTTPWFLEKEQFPQLTTERFSV